VLAAYLFNARSLSPSHFSFARTPFAIDDAVKTKANLVNSSILLKLHRCIQSSALFIDGIFFWNHILKQLLPSSLTSPHRFLIRGQLVLLLYLSLAVGGYTGDDNYGIVTA
jgi:hypothetical protein